MDSQPAPHRPSARRPASQMRGPTRRVRATEKIQPGTRPATRAVSLDSADTPHADTSALARLDAGKFSYGSELGRGGIAIVRAAEDTSLRRDLAVKFLQNSADRAAQAKFIEEAQITGQLQHPNIIPVYELGKDGFGRPFIALKRVFGRTLAEVIHAAHTASEAASRAESLRRLLEIFSKVCDAVAYAHSRGVIHRDLKPENIMVGDFGEVLVMDWGLAKPIGAADREAPAVTTDRRASKDSALTMHGTIVGTPAYMSPEQAGGMSAQLDEGADIYALGGTLYTILTDCLPVEGATTQAQLSAVLAHDFAPPSARVPRNSVQRELEAVVLKAMARRRRDRYATVLDLKADIVRFLDGRALEAADYTTWQRLLKFAARNKALVLGSAATAFSLLIGALAVLMVAHASEVEKLTLAAHAAQKEQARLDAEARAAREAREKAELEAHAKAVEREKRDADLRALVQKGEIDALKKELGVEITHRRDAALLEFDRLWAARPLGEQDSDFFARLGEREIRRFIDAFESILAASERFGEKFFQATDFFHLGMLYAGGLKQPEKAIGYYDRAIAMRPEFAVAIMNRGICHSDLGRRVEAMADYDLALKIDPTNGHAYRNRAMTWLEADRWREAEADLVRAEANGHADWTVYLNRGTCRMHLGEFDAALADFESGLALKPNSPELLLNIGLLQEKLGRLDLAVKTFSRLIEVAPGRAIGHFSRGNTHYDLGDFHAAIADFSRAIDLEPDHRLAYGNRGVARVDIGDFQGALDDLNVGIPREGNNSLLFSSRGTAKVKLGDLDGAMADFDTAFRLAPGDAGLRMHRGYLLLEAGRGDAAIADFQAAATIAPTMWEAHASLGVCYQAKEDFPAARLAFTEALKFCPADRRAPLENVLRELPADSGE